MPGSSSASHKDIKSALENKPLKFRIKTGGASYECQMYPDRAAYERSRPARASSADSVNSSSSSSSSSSGSK